MKERNIITLPSTAGDALDQLEGIGLLMTAKGWERAALVYALTEDRQGERNDLNLDEKSSKLSLTELAERGINGLGSRDSVRRYRQMWEEHGDTSIELGNTIVLPDIDWPPVEANKGSRVSANPRKAGEQLAEQFSGDELAEAIEAVADVDLDSAVKGTGRAAAKATERSMKESRADATDTASIGGRKRLTDKGAGDMLMAALTGTTGWEKVAELLDQPGLVLDETERDGLQEAIVRTTTSVVMVEAALMQKETSS